MMLLHKKMSFVFNNTIPDLDDVIDLYRLSGIYSDQWTKERIEKALSNSNVLLFCYDETKLVGLIRGITDHCWIAHISHLAVHPVYQGKSIGQELVSRVREKLGEQVAIMVHSSPTAKDFYQKVGFKPYDDVYRIPRLK